MINEVVEIKQYLNGEHIDKKYLYRMCYMLGKWYKQEGLNKLEARQLVFDWASKNGLYIKYNLNDILNKAYSDKSRLVGDVSVFISDDDIKEIKLRFDLQNVRLAALGILCYAKVRADADGVFDLSTQAFSNWLGISRSHMHADYIPELIDFKYIEKYSPAKQYTLDGRKTYQTNSYKLLVPFANIESTYQLKNNDIMKLYQDIFM